MIQALDEARQSVSIYLVRASGVPAVQAALFSPEGPSLELNAIPGGRFLALAAEPSAPTWIAFIRQLLQPNVIPDLLGQTPGGLLWVPRAGKYFIFSFGYAHTQLKEEWLEPEFGKKVTLSIVPQGQVVEVRAEQVFARRHIASERAPRAASVREFGFEADRDLVAAVEGVPAKVYLGPFGGKVRGGTSLKFGILPSKLLDTLDVIAERFDSGAHKKIWPQVDYLIAVREDARIARLDTELDRILPQPRAADRISLAAPALRSGERPYPEHFAIGRLGKNPVTAPYLLFGNWTAFVRGQKNTPSVAVARATAVHLLDENKEKIDACSFYECFGVEVSLNGQPFILSSGIWYEAKRQFVQDTNQVMLSLKAPPCSLPAWNTTDDEGTYNAGACVKDKSLWLFDKKLVPIGGGHSRLEFCDLMHWPTRTLYFVKQPTASAGLSHLCEQVRRTAENFFSVDDTFRKKLSANIVKEKQLRNVKWLATRPLRQDWHLCLVSMGKPASKFPFFAKCGLARLVRELDQGGYNVSFQSV